MNTVIDKKLLQFCLDQVSKYSQLIVWPYPLSKNSEGMEWTELNRFPRNHKNTIFYLTPQRPYKMKWHNSSRLAPYVVCVSDMRDRNNYI